MQGGLTSPKLTGRWAVAWWFIDIVLKTYGPLGVMLGVTIYYIVMKDQVIAAKDELLLKQQAAMVDLVKNQSTAMADVARNLDRNTAAVERLAAALERRGQ